MAECFQIGHVGVSMWDICTNLSPRMAEFNICLTSAHAAPTVVMTPDRVYAQSRTD
jgi:hypothetical protein